METLTNVENLANSNGNNTFSAIDNRIESVDDKEVNKALFRIYEALVPKLKRLEELGSEIPNVEASANAKEYIFDKRKVTIFIVLVEIICLVFAFFAFFGIYPEFLGAICAVLIIVLPIVFIIHKEKKVARKSKESIETSKALLEKDLQEFDQIKNEISGALTIVPPKYRNSKALNLIVEAYINSHADNLKEAVNYCSKQLSNETMMSIMSYMTEKMEQITYNQLNTQSQLSAIRRDIWISNILG